MCSSSSYIAGMEEEKELPSWTSIIFIIIIIRFNKTFWESMIIIIIRFKSQHLKILLNITQCFAKQSFYNTGQENDEQWQYVFSAVKKTMPHSSSSSSSGISQVIRDFIILFSNCPNYDQTKPNQTKLIQIFRKSLKMFNLRLQRGARAKSGQRQDKKYL